MSHIREQGPTCKSQCNYHVCVYHALKKLTQYGTLMNSSDSCKHQSDLNNKQTNKKMTLKFEKQITERIMFGSQNFHQNLTTKTFYIHNCL